MREQLLEIPASELMANITMNVRITGYRGWVIRLGIAVRLLQLAAWVAGFGIQIQIEKADNHEGTEAEADGEKET